MTASLSAETAADQATFASDLRFYVNGDPVVIRDVDPTMLLVDWLRSPDVGLTGTKKGCDQGGCGACTVMLSRWDPATETVERLAINSCLRPVAALDGMEITTTEGTGSSRSALSPVQYRIAKENGTQCGYCTPGFVMNMYSFLAARKGESATQREIEDLFDGNICRCTGYRAILYGMRHFASDWTKKDEDGCLETVVDASQEVPVQPAVNPSFPAALQQPRRALHYAKGGFHWYRPLTLADVHAILRRHPDSANVKLVVGNTSIGVYNTFVENPHVLIDISCVDELHGVVANDAGLTIGAATTYSDFLAELDRLIPAAGADQRAGLESLRYMARRTAGTIVRNAASLAGNTMLVVRHVGEGEPFPSDLFTALSSLGAEVHLSLGSGDVRVLPILDFAAQYQTSAELRDDAVLVRYVVPATRARELTRTYKTALREENAHSIVNAGIRVRFAAGSDTVEDAAIVLGGIGPVAFHAAAAEAALRGRSWSADTLRDALDALRRDVEQNIAQNRARMSGLIDEGFSNAYKLHLAEGYLYQFWVYAAEQLAPGSVPPEVQSAGERVPRPVSSGKQSYETDPSEYPVNLPVIKLGAFLQASGEAKYTHDIPLPRRGFESAVVSSMSAWATFTYRVPNAAGGGYTPATVDELIVFLQGEYDGFFDFVTARDMPAPSANTNGSGGISDPFFADGEVTYYGQCIGLVLTEDEQLAIRIAEFIATECIEYVSLGDPILTIAEARRQGSIFVDAPPFPVHIWFIERPGSDLAWAAGNGPEAEVSGIPCRIVSGTQLCGSQLHYYMETQSCLAVPGEMNQIVLHPSSQSPDSIHSGASRILHIPTAAVDVQIERVGGGYGGKTTRSPYVSGIAAAAAWKHDRPVRLAVRRENDSAMVGHRHPLYGEYALAIATGEDNPDHRGRLMGIKSDFFIDGGATYDCSFTVSDCLQLRCDTAYNIPNYRSSSDVCRTNKASNTAFRSMGLIQAMLVQEDAVEQAAHAIGMLPEDVRGKNLYQLGNQTPFGQVLDYCSMSYVWKRMNEMADFAKRLADVVSFNAANRWRKRGISMIPIKYASGYNAVFLEQAGALVEVYDQDGSVLVRHGGVEIGQGLMTKIAQIAAQTLNVPLSIIEMTGTDTQVVPNPVGTGASTGTAFNGGAVRKACRELRSRLEAFTLSLLDENGPDWCKSKGINFWDYPEGWRAVVAGSKGPNPPTVWHNIIAQAGPARINLSAQCRFQEEGGAGVDTGLHYKTVKVKDPNDPSKTIDVLASEVVNYFTDYTYSAACTEVEIDVLTGFTTVLRSDILYDIGDSLNPAIDIGQVEGAFVQGLGYVLSEEVIFQPDGPNKGALNTDNTWRYKLPATTSIPINFNVDLFPRSDATGVPANPTDLYSSKEVGEPPLVLAITAYFAVKHAVLAARRDRGHDEWFFLEAPATVQRIREACLVEAKDLVM
jgi:xanthine dehydrogenase/oxidase